MIDTTTFPLRADGYLRTGISNLNAAKRYLRRRFNQGAPEPVTSRPGARFYVTIADGNMRRSGFLLGPYASHLVALANVSRARRLAEQRDSMAWHYAYGTASMPSSRNTVFGR